MNDIYCVMLGKPSKEAKELIRSTMADPQKNKKKWKPGHNQSYGTCLYNGEERAVVQHGGSLDIREDINGLARGHGGDTVWVSRDELEPLEGTEQ